MSTEFGTILRGLLANRGLTIEAVARASARSFSTIAQLLTGRIPPSEETLRHIASVLEMPLADLLVIAGLPVDPPPAPPRPYPTTPGISRLIYAARPLKPEQLEQLAALARDMHDQNRTES